MDDERILVVEDEDIAREYMAEVLRTKGFDVAVAATGGEAVDILEKEPVALVLSDIHMPDMDGMRLLEHVKRRYPDTEVIMATGFASIENAVAAVKKGAFHYLPKPLRLEDMMISVERALEKRRLRVELRDMKLAAAGAGAPRILGNSEAMRKLREQIAQAARADCTVLILGDTGTGKELVARALHAAGNRRDKPFVAVNCAAFTGDLLANELFGHEKGAFTGAYSTRKGLLESASGGVFFLDEIGDMPLGMQAGLLRVLENRTMYRVGGTREIPVDVRIIAATNKDLAAMVENGAFRQDLFFRLNILSLRAPSLRERGDDIFLLAGHFVAEICAQLGKSPKSLDEQTLDLLAAYEYPGNVRELRHALERAVILCGGDSIRPVHLPPEMRGAEKPARPSTLEDGPAKAGGEEACSEEVLSLEEVERRHLVRVLEMAGGSTGKAAKLLGLNRGSLWRKLKRFGLSD